MIGVKLEPLDTLFFRDGTPFFAGESRRGSIKPIFPPHPPTVVGALRAALARGNGWDGKGSWSDCSEDVGKTLGDGPDDLGKLSFDAPILLRDGQPLFRAPRHLLFKDNSKPTALLRPGDSVRCDLGDVRLPTLPKKLPGDVKRNDLDTGDNLWLTAEGMNAVLRGSVPSDKDVISDMCLWKSEYRVGLGRNRETRTAEEGMLYSANHIRLRRDVSLGARIHGLPDDWKPPLGDLLPLGGEGRLAACSGWEGELGIESPFQNEDIPNELTVTALSPLDLDEAAHDGRQSTIAELGNGKVVSACIDRPQQIGGWDTRKREPLPLRSALPAGSVLFCEISDTGAFEKLLQKNNGIARVGRKTNGGFGLVALGRLPS